MKLKVLAYLVGALLIPLAACDDDPATTTTTDACEDLSLTCDANATCNETADPAVCECNTGFTGDGETCTAETLLTTTAAVWTQVSAGGVHHEWIDDLGAHTCGIQDDGTLWCWGSNRFGQLGNDSVATTATATQVGTDTDWINVSANGARTCGIRGASGKGTMWCWGQNIYRQENNSKETIGLLGLGATFDTTLYVATPTQVGTESDWVDVGLSLQTNCGIRDDGTDRTLWCWGDNTQGTLGDGNGGTDSNVPVQETNSDTDWASIPDGAIGYEGSTMCGLQDDGAGSTTIWCWGYAGSRGMTPVGGTSVDTPEIGHDSTADGDTDGDTDWQTIAYGGDQNNCAIKTDGTLWCAGGSDHGQTGSGAFATVTVPDQITGVGSDTGWTDVSYGRQHACAINSGSVYCWGRNHEGELGLGDVSAVAECAEDNHNYDGHWDCHTPLLVDDTNTYVSVTSGRGQNCGLTDAGDIYCWGNNAYGQTGVDAPGWVEPTKLQ